MAREGDWFGSAFNLSAPLLTARRALLGDWRVEQLVAAGRFLSFFPQYSIQFFLLRII